MTCQVFEPVDPNSITILEMLERVRSILRADLNGTLVEQPVGPGKFRCWLCRRIMDRTLSDEEMRREQIRRFGSASEDHIIICEDCDSIISRYLGLPA